MLIMSLRRGTAAVALCGFAGVIDAQLRYTNATTGATLHACDNNARVGQNARSSSAFFLSLHVEAAEAKAELQNVSLNQTSPMPGRSFIAPGAFTSAKTCYKMVRASGLRH